MNRALCRMNRKASHGCRSARASDSAWSCVGVNVLVVLLWIVVVVAVGDEKAVAPCGCNDAARAITSTKRTEIECEMFVGCIVSVSRLLVAVIVAS